MEYPGAKQRLLGPQTQSRLRKKNKVIVHTMVGSLDGTDAYFRAQGFTGVESHFGTGGDGTVYQWQDTRFTADAQLEGNDDCISIENADHGPEFANWTGSNVPKFTDKQLHALVDLIEWLCRHHDIPAHLISDTEDATKGIGYHRQGIEPWRKHGELYSESTGKVCPGDRRIKQLTEIIIPRVAARLNGEEPMTPEDKEWVKTTARNIAKQEAGKASRNVLVRVANFIIRTFNSDGSAKAPEGDQTQ